MSRSRSSATGPAPWPCSVTVTAACSGAGRSWSRSPRPRSGTRSARLAEAALALVGSARYAGLATVEFLVQDDTIAFAEVNPRLQVEHTVTEQVTGLDLVELGLRVADGATLPDLALAARPRGAAIQVRVNTETPRRTARSCPAPAP